jgi:hypothetical protein
MPAKKAPEQLGFGFMRKKQRQIHRCRYLAPMRGGRFAFIYRSGELIFGVKSEENRDVIFLDAYRIHENTLRPRKTGIEKFTTVESCGYVQAHLSAMDLEKVPEKYKSGNGVVLIYNSDIRDKGLAENLARICIEFGRKKGAKIAVCYILYTNKASQRVARKLGFVKSRNSRDSQGYETHYLPLDQLAI